LNGSVGKISKAGKKISAELLVKNNLGIWMKQLNNFGKKGAYIKYDKMWDNKGNLKIFLALLGFLPPEDCDEIMYIGDFSEIGGEIHIKFHTNTETLLISICNMVLDYIGGFDTNDIIKIRNLKEDLLNIPPIYDATICLKALYYQNLDLDTRIYLISKIVWDIKKTIFDYNKEFTNVLNSIISDFLIPSKKDLIGYIWNILNSLVNEVTDRAVYNILALKDGPEIYFVLKDYPEEEMPNISYINPTNVEEGTFTIEIFGENFNSESEIKCYSESTMKLYTYLDNLSSTDIKIIASGTIGNPGKYLISVLNPNNTESNRVSLTVYEPNQSPVAKFEMSSQDKTAYENQTLNLTVSSGDTATVDFSASRSSDPDGSIASYEWKISGTKVSTSRDFSYDLGKGTHDIYLTVTDNNGATDSVGGTVVVSEEGGINPTLSVSPTSGKQGTTFYYSGNNYTPNGTIEWHVKKPDGTEYPPADLTGKVDGNGNFSHSYTSHCDSQVGTYTIWAIDKSSGNKSNDVKEEITSNLDCVNVSYQGHFANTGWGGWYRNGETCGTPDGNQMEAIKIKLVDAYNIGFDGITYRAHIAHDGWLSWVSDGTVAGTTGQGKALEAIEIKLVDAPYDLHVSYRVYVQGIGWQEWKSDGQTAGTTGQSLAIQAIEIKLQVS